MVGCCQHATCPVCRTALNSSATTANSATSAGPPTTTSGRRRPAASLLQVLQANDAAGAPTETSSRRAQPRLRRFCWPPLTTPAPQPRTCRLPAAASPRCHGNDTAPPSRAELERPAAAADAGCRGPTAGLAVPAADPRRSSVVSHSASAAAAAAGMSRGRRTTCRHVTTAARACACECGCAGGDECPLPGDSGSHRRRRLLKHASDRFTTQRSQSI